MKKKLSFFLTLLLCLVLVTGLLAGCGEDAGTDGTGSDVATATATVSAGGTPTFTLTQLDNEVFHTPEQTEYLLNPVDSISKYAEGQKELSRPKAINLDYTVERNGVDSLGTQHILIGETEDLSDAKEYVAREGRVSMYNLKVGTTYYWRVVTDGDAGKFSSEISSFTTDDAAPRNLYIDGITNARDLGGWKTEDGGRVRQGMIYRTGRLTASYTGKTEIKSKGISVMVDDLGMRTEIDLRGIEDEKKETNETGGITKSALGDSVKYYRLPLDYGNVGPSDIESVKAIFALLADEANYPLFYHCSIGTDRTGKLSFLLNALLGVGEDDLYRDYLFSNFGNIGGSRAKSNISGSYVLSVKRAAGNTLSEKAYNYLTKAGVPAADIDAFLRIMKEPAA